MREWQSWPGSIGNRCTRARRAASRRSAVLTRQSERPASIAQSHYEIPRPWHNGARKCPSERCHAGPSRWDTGEALRPSDPSDAPMLRRTPPYDGIAQPERQRWSCLPAAHREYFGGRRKASGRWPTRNDCSTCPVMRIWFGTYVQEEFFAYLNWGIPALVMSTAAAVIALAAA